MNEPNHHQIATYLIDYALSELVIHRGGDGTRLQFRSDAGIAG